MHRALEIEEILFDIFHHCCLPGLSAVRCTPDLVALARTYRTFKEPALDVLWSVLFDLSPLARCLPEASHRLPNMYGFKRPLRLTEWHILQSYSRRIRSIQYFKFGLDRRTLMILSHPPITDSLFPNLRDMRCIYAKKNMPLLHLPLPSLVSLNVKFENAQSFQNSLQSFPKFSPNIERLRIRLPPSQAASSKIELSYIGRWQNLRSVVCPEFTLDVDVLLHLSHMPALTQLRFTLCTTLQASDSPLLFSNLDDLTLHSYSLDLISQLLSQTRLPAITALAVFIDNCPSKQGLSFFLDGIQTSGVSNTIQTLLLMDSSRHPNVFPRWEAPLLGFEDLRPFMAYRNIRHIGLNIKCDIGLTNSELLTLTSSWPKLQHLQINTDWGWNSQGRGLTPDGLLRLLQTCQSLNHIAVPLDVRGYTESPPSQTPKSLGLTLPPRLFIDILDSAIEAESVPAIATFFARLAACSDFSFHYWRNWRMREHLPLNAEDYSGRWDDVYNRVNQRSESSDLDVE